ncbi:MAG: metal ABC transporter substrate-binding protein [Spirochaetota bacterium]
MKKILMTLMISAIFISAAYAEKLHIVTTYPYIASIAEQIGKDRIKANALARGDYDPHTIIPKPSFIAKLRKADLLIISGAQLEIGWLPPLLKQANNAVVNPGRPGFLDLSTFVKLIDVPTSVSRDQGDIHPDGNPHFYLNPGNIPLLAEAITKKFSEIDIQNSSYYKTNCKEFLSIWSKKTEEWKKRLSLVKGKSVIEYHKNYDYLLRAFGLSLIGTVESLPGIPPSANHIASLEKIIGAKKIDFILQDVYNPDEAANHLSKKYGIRLIKLPHDVGAVREAEGIISLFDEIVRRLTQ